MFSFQTGTRSNWWLFPNLFFNKRSNICNGQLPVFLAQHCSNKCLFQIQQFKKAAARQEQQFRMFWHSCLLQNSPNISSSMPVTLDMDEATTIGVKQQLEETEKQRELAEPKQIQKENVKGQGAKLFARRFYPGQSHQERISIYYKMGKSGQKYFKLEKGFGQTTYNFGKICTPQNVFTFVHAIDEVLEVAHANQKIIEALTMRQERPILHNVKSKGIFYDYQLELYVFNNAVYVQMRTVPNKNKPAHRARYMFLSLHQFHWMRHTIGKLLAENGEGNVQQQLGKPPGYPTWLNRDGIPFVLLNRNHLQQRPVIPTNTSHLAFASQQGIGQRPYTGYNNRNQYNSIRNLVPDYRHNMQLQQPQNMQFDQRQLPQRVAPVQQQPPQQMKKEVPWSSPSSSPPSEEMSEQLLQLVFLQQQQLQQIQSTILKDQPMGGVGGASAQKMGPDNTILMSELLAQAQQPTKKWTGNNSSYRKNWSSGNKFWNNQGYRTGDEY